MCLVAGLATLLASATARAAFHLWNIREVYTDASGSSQFIEFFTAFSSQQFVGGQQVTVTPAGGGTAHTFTIPSNLPLDTANRAFLLATAGADAAGAPTPDYVIPSNFLFPGGGTISFFGANGGAYTALPTDGVNSRTWAGGNAPNTPQNFAGQTGTVVPAVNMPPSISITNLPDNMLFAAPGTVPVSVSASDDGSVANVQLLTNGVPAATNNVAPFGFTLNNLAAGFYTLRARAEDNQALAATSAPVTVRIADRPMLTALPGTNGPIQFLFATATGISYVVEYSDTLAGFSPLVTIPGNGGTIRYSDTGPVVAQRHYRVRLQ